MMYKLHELVKILLENFYINAKIVTENSESVIPVKIIIEPPSIIWCLEDGKMIHAEVDGVSPRLHQVTIGLVVFGSCREGEIDKTLETTLEHMLLKVKIRNWTVKELQTKLQYTKCSIIITNIEDKVTEFLNRHGIRCIKLRQNILKCCIE